MKLSQAKKTRFSPDADVIIAFMAQKSGAERSILERLAKVVLAGEEVHPYIQRVANVVIAQAVLVGKLPEKKVGRGLADGFRGHEVAYRFFELTDAGTLQKDALEVVQREHGFEERRIRTFVKKYRSIIGYFSEDRDAYRAWRNGAADYEASVRMNLRILEGLPAVPSNDKTKLKTAREALQSIRHELLSVTSGPN